MSKVHTRIKRKYGLTTSFRNTKLGSGQKKPRPRTFKTEEAAKLWASQNNIKQDSFTLIKVKKDKRFQIVKK